MRSPGGKVLGNDRAIARREGTTGHEPRIQISRSAHARSHPKPGSATVLTVADLSQREYGTQDMSDLEERVLGLEAVLWIRRSLHEGTFSRLLAGRFDLTSGRIVTLVPPFVSEEATKMLSRGLLPESSADVAETPGGVGCRVVSASPIHQALADLIRRFLSDRPDGLCIFEDRLARPGDGWLSRSGTIVVTVQNDVYHVLSKADIYSDRIERTVDVVSRAYPPLVGALTRCLDEAEGAPLTYEMLAELADHTERIAIGAYDGEGFVLWSRQ